MYPRPSSASLLAARVSHQRPGAMRGGTQIALRRAAPRRCAARVAATPCRAVRRPLRCHRSCASCSAAGAGGHHAAATKSCECRGVSLRARLCAPGERHHPSAAPPHLLPRAASGLWCSPWGCTAMAAFGPRWRKQCVTAAVVRVDVFALGQHAPVCWRAPAAGLERMRSFYPEAVRPW